MTTGLIILGISRGLKTAIMAVALIVVFYIFLIRPQSQQAKQEESYRRSLKKGDRVMTTGGIHATVVSTSGNYAQIEVCRNTRIRVLLSSLSPLPQTKEASKEA